MPTRKEIRELQKALSSVEEVVRQKTLQILRNTPNKEQAASMIARQTFQIVRQEIEPLRKAMIQFRDEWAAKETELAREREESARKTEREIARLERETKEDESGEEWKNGRASNI